MRFASDASGLTNNSGSDRACARKLTQFANHLLFIKLQYLLAAEFIVPIVGGDLMLRVDGVPKPDFGNDRVARHMQQVWLVTKFKNAIRVRDKPSVMVVTC